VSACEAFWVKCPRSARKVAIFENVFKREQKLWLCDDHAVEFADEDTRQRLLNRALETLHVMRTAGGMRLTAQELDQHPAQLALLEHQVGCSRCANVRDWIVREQIGGRVRGQADIHRIGEYVVAHCCPVGVQLNYEVGVAMQGTT